jgi:Na+-driven multidrug efflux pump
MLRQVVLIVPLLLVLPGFLGLDAVWMTNPLSDAISALALTLFLAAETRSCVDGAARA